VTLKAVRTPQPTADNPQSADLNPQSADLDPRSADLNLQSADLNPQSADLNPQSAVPNPQSAVPNPQSAVPNPHSDEPLAIRMPVDIRSVALTVLAVLAIVLMLQYAQAMIIPIVLGVLKNNPARRFYERLGFTVVGETDMKFMMRREPHPPS